MLHLLPAPLRGIVASLLLGLNTLFWAMFLFPMTLVRLVSPTAGLRRRAGLVLAAIAECWIACNRLWMDLVQRTQWQVSGLEGMSRQASYLVTSNHQSWVDILVLQYQLNRRIPLMRFFLKRELLYVPVMGLAWWALDFPFMGRYSRQQIARNPELGRKDMETTRKACEKFSDIPVSVMSFVEGTRFTEAKHASQQSPYRHLLRPKSGGVAFVLDAMGSGLQAILDVTLVFPAGRPSMIDLMAGRIPEVRVLVRQRPIPAELGGGDYQNDRAFRARFQQWMNGLWAAKDADIERLRSGQLRG